MNRGSPATGGAASHQYEVAAGNRFEFGSNWLRFLRVLDSGRVADAEQSLRQMLEVESLQGMSFLDAGSGSGLFSLAARRLGARVRSFDFDPQSIACTKALRDRLSGQNGQAVSDADWRIEEGSVLDRDFLEALGEFDIVYSWGVLHHTGNMWTAMENVSRLVRRGGRLFIAIYNDQGWQSLIWTQIKKFYNRYPATRWLLILLGTPFFVILRWMYRAAAGRGKVGRGMTLWYDMIDWLGGYPFEVARPEEVFRFLHARGFALRQLTTEGGRAGCNEFVFERVSSTACPSGKGKPGA